MAKERITTADKTITRKRKISISETSSTSSTKETSSSVNNTNIVKTLTSASYEALSTAFNQMSETKKWKLKDGVYVEDLLYDYAISRKRENLSHSFVINMNDRQLKDKFGEHWCIVKTKNTKTLPSIPADLLAHLMEISTLKTYKELDSLKNYCFYEQTHLYVVTECLRTVINTYRNGFFSRTKLLEVDILVNIWIIVDQVINSYDLQAKRGEPSSVSSSARRNRDRTIEEMQRKKVGRKNDLIICSKSGIELGCGEAGLDPEEFDTKVIVESSLKTPKTMHDMFIRLCRSVDNKQEVIKKLQIVGLAFSRCKVRMLIMDCPDGYICRLRGTTAAGFSEEEKTLGLDFCKVYQLIWMAMEVCKQVESIVQNNRSTAAIKFESDDNHSDDEVYLPYCLHSPKRD
ncbi:hypothetical protein G6F47_006485 [Rhizopus delemar]|nr:hypothetical protein G6F47_006485 [Rhizopus delemar]